MQRAGRPRSKAARRSRCDEFAGIHSASHPQRDPGLGCHGLRVSWGHVLGWARSPKKCPAMESPGTSGMPACCIERRMMFQTVRRPPSLAGMKLTLARPNSSSMLPAPAPVRAKHASSAAPIGHVDRGRPWHSQIAGVCTFPGIRPPPAAGQCPPRPAIRPDRGRFVPSAIRPCPIRCAGPPPGHAQLYAGSLNLDTSAASDLACSWSMAAAAAVSSTSAAFC